MKLIFLDFDGVLNCQDAYHQGFCKHFQGKEGFSYDQFYPQSKQLFISPNFFYRNEKFGRSRDPVIRNGIPPVLDFFFAIISIGKIVLSCLINVGCGFISP